MVQVTFKYVLISFTVMLIVLIQRYLLVCAVQISNKNIILYIIDYNNKNSKKKKKSSMCFCCLIFSYNLHICFNV